MKQKTYTYKVLHITGLDKDNVAVKLEETLNSVNKELRLDYIVEADDYLVVIWENA